MTRRAPAMMALLAVCAAACAPGEYADYFYLPPQDMAKRLPPMPPAWYAGQPHRVIQLEADATPQDANATKATPWIAGAGADLSLDAASLFSPGTPENGAAIYTAALYSPGARAVRLQADLSNLNDGDELWLFDAQGTDVCGPFTTAHGTQWLPTMLGDTIVLAIRAPGGALPPMRITAFAPIDAVSPKGDADACHPSIACQADPILQEIAAGIGTLVMNGRDNAGRPAIFLCTGALLNNPLTDAREPLLLTANHCFDGIAVEDAEVLWDQRFGACGELGPPPGGALRSKAVQFLAESRQFDSQLVQLDEIPVGRYGRCWLGWDTTPPEKDDDVYALHQPRGKPLEVSLGYVADLGVDTLFGHNQVEVKWNIGYTDSGSSGSPGVLPARNYRVFGALSNGYFLPSCGNPNNADHYASLGDFFPRIQPYLYSPTPSTTPAPPEPAVCPLSLLFGDKSATAESLRFLRDGASFFSLGKNLVRAYYVWAPPTTASLLQR